jgi:protein-disulfide isomerase
MKHRVVKGASLSNILAVVAVGCALVVTALVVKRELSADASLRPRSIRDYAPIEVTEWDDLTVSGRRIGPDSALLTIVEFGDFQCPGCRQFQLRALEPMQRAHPDEVAVVFYHWPLPYHRSAYQGARMAECAAAQGRFSKMVSALYHWQDSLGYAASRFFATEAGVGDVAAFDACAASTDSLDRVSADIERALRLGGTGTPTLIVNGQLLRYVPDSAGLFAILKQAREEKP